MQRILLADNGSKRPAATLMLRSIAAELSARSGYQVEAVSLQHADAIDAAELNGEPAQVLPRWLRDQLTAGMREFILLPLFFGKSRALTSYVPEQTALLKQVFGDFSFKLARELYPMPALEPAMADILLQQIQISRAQLQGKGHRPRAVVLVDHGTPVASVNAVRRSLADALAARLDIPLHQACMERREGAEYDFNGDLLEHWLTEQAQQGLRSVVVSMLFLLPGRHAGSGGDIAEICAGVQAQYPDLQIAITPLVGESSGLIDLLQQRLDEVLRA